MALGTVGYTEGSGKNVVVYIDASTNDHPVGMAEFLVGTTPTLVSAANPMPIVQTGTPALPTGAATSANQATEITSLASLDTKTPALGQALAAASTPVVLTAIQQAALTPPAAITGFATEAGNLATIAGKDFATQTTLAALNAKVTACNTGAVVVSSSALPSGASTAAKQPALGTAGTASADVISVQGIASMTPLATNWSQVLDPANDGIRTRIISGVLDDGTGVALTIKTAKGQATASGVNAAITAVASKKIRVLSYSLQAANANGAVVAANWQDDTGTPVVLSQTWELAAREGISKALSMGPGFYFQTTSGQALKLNLGSALAVNWELVYVEA